MKIQQLRTCLAALTISCCAASGGAAWAQNGHEGHDNGSKGGHTTGLVREVIQATSRYRDVTAAQDDGWASTGNCVSGPDDGAMGVHFVNTSLIGDGAVDAKRPEALIYEARHGRLQLVGVEYILLADAWHAANGAATPVLKGQLFHYNSSPNRYGLPAFYALHVWAWRDNPHGVFTNWNPNVSCEEYVAN